MEPATSKKPRGRAAASKKRSQPVPAELTQKQKKLEPMVKDKLAPKGKKVVKRKATKVDG
jgi:hypothetical protein